MTALDLGPTLFIPATHKNLEDILYRKKHTNLKSLLIDTEDSLDSLEEGLEVIQKLLKHYIKTNLLVFIRPRNPGVLKKILLFENIHTLDGFILPKFSLANANDYLRLLEKSEHRIMPSIEGEELFNQGKLIQLKEVLFKYKYRIPLVRFGLEDMLRQLKMKRSCEDSIFDFSATASMLGIFIGVFKSAGYEISGGVYPCFKDDKGFIRDVFRDLREGLLSKTIIHPQQIELFNIAYQVKQSEYDDAQEICNAQDVVFNQNYKMAEVPTMNAYAKQVLCRAKIYGIAK